MAEKGSKQDAGEVIGLEGLRAIVNSVSIPVVGIGGINLSNIEAVKSTGANGISLISGILSQDDTYQAAKELISIWEK